MRVLGLLVACVPFVFACGDDGGGGSDSDGSGTAGTESSTTDSTATTSTSSPGTSGSGTSTTMGTSSGSTGSGTDGTTVGTASDSDGTQVDASCDAVCTVVEMCGGPPYDRCFPACVDGTNGAAPDPACQDALIAGNFCIGGLTCEEWEEWGMGNVNGPDDYPCKQEDIDTANECSG